MLCRMLIAGCARSACAVNCAGSAEPRRMRSCRLEMEIGLRVIMLYLVRLCRRLWFRILFRHIPRRVVSKKYALVFHTLVYLHQILTDFLSFFTRDSCTGRYC